MLLSGFAFLPYVYVLVDETSNGKEADALPTVIQLLRFSVSHKVTITEYVAFLGAGIA